MSSLAEIQHQVEAKRRRDKRKEGHSIANLNVSVRRLFSSLSWNSALTQRLSSATIAQVACSFPPYSVHCGKLDTDITTMTRDGTVWNRIVSHVLRGHHSKRRSTLKKLLAAHGREQCTLNDIVAHQKMDLCEADLTQANFANIPATIRLLLFTNDDLKCGAHASRTKLLREFLAQIDLNTQSELSNWLDANELKLSKSAVS